MIIQRSMIVLLILLQVACAVQKQDELECVLPNGDAFLLINQYDYDYASVIFAPIAWHGAKRLNQYGFKAYYKPKDGKMLKESLGTFGHFNVADEMVRKEKCAQFLQVKNIATWGAQGYTFINGHLSVQKLNSVDWAIAKKALDKIEKDGKFKWIFNWSMWLQNGDVLREEYPLCSTNSYSHELSKSLVGKVMYYESTNGGQTWSDPIITKDAKLFEIGKSILDQPAVAKPKKWKKGPG